MIRIRGALAVLFGIAACLHSPPSLANGRFPRAQRLLENPANSNELFLSATYGILTTADAGKNWYHICETAFAFDEAYQGDSLLSFTDAGSLIVSTQGRVSTSADRACNWSQTLPRSSDKDITYVDFTIARAASQSIIVAASSTRAPSRTELLESDDNGNSWKPLGVPLPASVIHTIDVAPSDASIIYATGLSNALDGKGLFLVSKDRGATWTTFSIPNTGVWANPYIAAVHPTDPRKIFVRTDAWKNSTNVETADDALLLSRDGGQTWEELLHPGGPADDSPGAKLLGFALSPDGSTALAGYGDPVDGSRFIETAWLGVYRSSSDDKYSFGVDPANPTQAFAEPVSCLAWTQNGIYVCVTPQTEPAFLAVASKPTFSSRADMRMLLRVNETKGPPPSCGGRACTACDWSTACSVLGACNNAGTVSCSIGGGAGTSNLGGAGGRDSATSQGGTSEPSTPTAAQHVSSEQNGSSCMTATTPKVGGYTSLFWLTIGGIARRVARTRRRKRQPRAISER